MAAEDWTAASDKFKLADAVLREDFGQAAALMTKIGLGGEIHKAGYRDWPLFKEFRRTDVFQETFQQIFGESALRAETIDKETGASAKPEENGDGESPDDEPTVN